MKTPTVVGVAVALAIAGGAWYWLGGDAQSPGPFLNDDGNATSTIDGTTSSSTPPVACTEEAKLCPDGSAVGRTGPNCEFAPCPTRGILPYQSGVRGTVLLGPTCPVMQDPPDPGCADKPYATTIEVRRTGSSSILATGASKADGTFEFSLAPGAYTLSAVGGKTLPRCSSVDAVVGATGYVTADISCDTGIR